MTKVVRSVLTGMAVLAACAASATPAAAQNPLFGSPGVDPPGVNDFTCKPPPKHRYPVVLVHGTFGDRTYTSPPLAPPMQRLGYCVFALDYGSRGTGPIEKSAEQLKVFVDRVLAATGAKRVSIVGHSQGGMMPRYYIKFLGGAEKVDDLVGISPSTRGTTNPGAPTARDLGCVACGQQIAGSDFLKNLNAGDLRPPPVSYTVIETRNDEVVMPFDSEFLPETGDGRVTNILLQDKCPSDAFGHTNLPYDPVTGQWVLSALGRPGAADPGFTPDCAGAGLSSFPDSDSGTVRDGAPGTGPAPATPRRCRTTVRSKRPGRHATGLRRNRVGCARARRVVAAWLRRSGNPRRFGHWTCRRRTGRGARVRCAERRGRRVTFAARR